MIRVVSLLQWVQADLVALAVMEESTLARSKGMSTS